MSAAKLNPVLKHAANRVKQRVYVLVNNGWLVRTELIRADGGSVLEVR